MKQILLILLISFFILFMILKYNNIDLRRENFVEDINDDSDTDKEVIEDETEKPAEVSNYLLKVVINILNYFGCHLIKDLKL